MKTVKIYTDGACRGNPGLGGWGVLMVYETKEKKYDSPHGGFRIQFPEKNQILQYHLLPSLE